MKKNCLTLVAFIAFSLSSFANTDSKERSLSNNTQIFEKIIVLDSELPIVGGCDYSAQGCIPNFGCYVVCGSSWGDFANAMDELMGLASWAQK